MFGNRQQTIGIITRQRPLSPGEIAVGILLALTVMVGAYFRFMGNNWDDYVHFHPDERYLTGVAIRLGESFATCADASPDCVERMDRVERCRERHPDTDGRGGYFDSDCSPYNPENITLSQYSYGTLPLFAARQAAEFVEWRTGNPIWTDYDGLHRVWRTLNAAIDTVVILVIFAIGLRLHSKWTGLVAAMLYAGAVFPIQLSHFATTDVITNLFVTLAIYFAVRTQDTGSLWDYAGFGLALGAAVASRVNVAPLAGVIVLVAVVRGMPVFDSRLAWRERSRLLNRHFGGLLLAGVLSIVVFRLFNPYAFKGPYVFGILPYDRFLDALAQSRHMASSEAEWPPSWQWLNRTPYLFSFQNIVLWGLGIGLGAAAWLAWLWSGWRLVRGKLDALRNLVPFVWILGYYAWIGGIWVMSMRYYLPLYPALVLLAAWGLVELVRRASIPSAAQWRKAVSAAALVGVVGFTVLWAAMFTNIYRHMATFTQASQWVWENLPGDFYMQLDGADPAEPLINIPIWNTSVPPGTPLEDTLVAQASRLSPGVPTSVRFVAPASGTISTVHAYRLGDPLDTGEERTLRVTITKRGDNTPLTIAELTSAFPRGGHFLGQPYTLTFDPPLQVEFEETYFFNVEVEGDSPITSAGTVMLNEPWDEGMPAKVCTLPAGMSVADDPPSGLLSSSECDGRSALDGLFNSLTLDLHWEDEPVKRDRMQIMLDQADAIIIGTNRRYDSQSRNPQRWPLTLRYYDALFSGELGFDLVATFQETFEFGSLHLSDQHLPTSSSPEWLNEFEPEEAFHVYDHPVVFIFQKNEDYSPSNTRTILHSVELNRVGLIGGYNDPTIVNVIAQSSAEANAAPTHLMFTNEMQETQTEGGTWSDRFDAGSLINRNQIVALVVWWLAIVVFGFAAWPLLFVTLPALADRGYGFAKIVGLMLVAWGTWVLATLRVPVWSQIGVLGGLLTLTTISAFVAWRNREKLASYLQARWRFLAVMEVASFILFMVLVGIRLTNPDLWHPVFGGEKPMDFAFFNGVLRSTVFPPIDPWFSGGYSNYYYFGYVIVGAPTLLLGVVPSLAYNLILPTLFAVTGIGAFSVAFSIANGWRKPEPPVLPSDDAPASEPMRSKRLPMGNPWVAGVMALLLAVVLGNLDTPRVFTIAVAQLDGYERPSGLYDYLVDEYIEEHGALPDEAATLALFERTEDSRVSDRLRYEAHKISSLVTHTIGGFGQMLTGKDLYVSPERWFWGPTRVISEIPNQHDGAINEMPFFTFLYADMHPHMISMPMMLFALAFLYNELMVAGRDRRTLLAQIGALGLGALTVGLFFPTNTWDYPTFLILGVAGLGYAWWLVWKRFTRWSVLDAAARVGGFAVLTQLVMLPFTWWFASGEGFRFWEGKKTPLWAYLDIHGLFIFLIFCLLVWEAVRWLRSVRVADLRGAGAILTGVLAWIILALLVALALAFSGYQIALVIVPLVAWITVLFFRPGQVRPMRFVLVLAGLGLCITMGTEFVALTHDNGRQNTIFKFYIQVWLLFSVAGGVGFAWLVRDSLRWRTRVASIWYVVAGGLIFIAALYPLMATRGKAEFRFTHDMPLTLDGMDYMRYATHYEDGVSEPFELVHDYNVIRWLQENVEGSPVIIEAISGRVLYQWGARIANNTGLPSVVGWDYHERQRRSLDPLPALVSQRVANVNAFYTTRDVDAAINILRHYNVEYVIVSAYERVRYEETGGLDKFDWLVNQGILRVVYQESEAAIYRVNRDVLYGVWAANLPGTGAE